MTDLSEKIAALREAVSKMTPGEWCEGATHRSKTDPRLKFYETAVHYGSPESRGNCIAMTYGHGPLATSENDASGIVALRNNALSIIDEQAQEIASKDAEIERLHRALDAKHRPMSETVLAVREVEKLRARVAELEDARMDIIGQNGNDGLHYVEAEAGPTPLRGRITGRNRENDEGSDW